MCADCSFVAWRVHVDRMARQKKTTAPETTSQPPPKEDNEDNEGVLLVNEDMPLGRLCFSPPLTVECGIPESETFLREENFINSAPEADPLQSTPHIPITKPNPPSPSPYAYSKGPPRFYSVIWTGTDRFMNGEYLLPDLDYPGRVLLSESAFQVYMTSGMAKFLGSPE